MKDGKNMKCEKKEDEERRVYEAMKM
jgi:hypothetical protein